MLLLALIAACSTDPASTSAPTVSEPDKAELDQRWTGIPLQRGQWPDWVPADHTREEAVADGADGADGPRRAWRIAFPRPAGAGEGSTSWGVVMDQWQLKHVPDEGPARTWQLTLFGEPERSAGVPIQLQPNGASVVGVAEPATVRGVIDFGPGAHAFACLGADADLDPQGWCLQLLSQTWLQTWQG